MSCRISFIDSFDGCIQRMVQNIFITRVDFVCDFEHYINKKPGTQINPIQPRFQGIILQNGKRKDNKNEKENVSIHNSIKSGNSLYIPKRDNGPILDIENIS